jgi:hypothetical protein
MYFRYLCLSKLAFAFVRQGLIWGSLGVTHLTMNI